MAEVSFLHFPDEEQHQHDCLLEGISALDSFPFWSHIYGSDCHHHSLSSIDEEDDEIVFSGEIHNQVSRGNGNPRSDPGDRKNQVNFVMDLLHQRVEQSHVVGGDDLLIENVNETNFGVIEEIGDVGVDCLDVELGLGLELGDGIGFDRNSVDVDDDDENEFNFGGFVVSDCGDEFCFAWRESGNGNGNGNDNPATLARMGGLRIVGIESDSEGDEDDGGDGMLGIELQSEEEDYGIHDLCHADACIPLCWDSFQLEDHIEANNDFEWEEVDDRVDEREVLSVVADPDEVRSVVLPIVGDEEEEAAGERERRNLEWEVLLNIGNLDRNPEFESDDGPYFGDHEDYIYTAEYEMMFGQFADGENPLLSHPPASKSVVEQLPSVMTTKEDLENEKALCAVCKDQIEVGEEGKQLPCTHRYHGDCFLPWLGIRNTCPVCRYELPTDDPEYEQRRTRRTVRLL